MIERANPVSDEDLVAYLDGELSQPERSVLEVSNGYDNQQIEAEYEGAPPTGTLAASFNPITYGTKIKDSTNSYSGNIWTAPATAKYTMMAQAAIAGTYSTGNVTAIGFSLDGAAPTRYSQEIAYGSVAALAPKVIWKNVSLNAGQTIEVEAYTDASGASFSSSSALNYFSIYKENPAQRISADNIILGKANTSAGQSISSGSYTIVNFDNVLYDTHGSITTGAGWQMEIHETGFYWVKARCTFDASSWAANTSLGLAVYKNTGSVSPYLAFFRTEAASGSDLPSVEGSDIYYFEAGDLIDIRVFQNNGGAKSLAADSTLNSVTITKYR